MTKYSRQFSMKFKECIYLESHCQVESRFCGSWQNSRRVSIHVLLPSPLYKWRNFSQDYFIFYFMFTILINLFLFCIYSTFKKKKKKISSVKHFYRSTSSENETWILQKYIESNLIFISWICQWSNSIKRLSLKSMRLYVSPYIVYSVSIFAHKYLKLSVKHWTEKY